MANVVASKGIQERVRTLIALHGITKTAKLLDVGREAVIRISGGVSVRAATVTHAEGHLGAAEKA